MFFNEYIKTGQNDDKPIQNQFYLIDKKSFQNWKNNVGYNEFRDYFKERMKLDDNDYNNDFIKSVIKYCSVANKLLPFNNKNFYNNGKIKSISRFCLC